MEDANISKNVTWTTDISDDCPRDDTDILKNDNWTTNNIEYWTMYGDDISKMTSGQPATLMTQKCVDNIFGIILIIFCCCCHILFNCACMVVRLKPFKFG